MYRKYPTIRPGLIYFRKPFLMGLYKEELIYEGASLSNKSNINKSVINRNKLNMF